MSYRPLRWQEERITLKCPKNNAAHLSWSPLRACDLLHFNAGEVVMSKFNRFVRVPSVRPQNCQLFIGRLWFTAWICFIMKKKMNCGKTWEIVCGAEKSFWTAYLFLARSSPRESSIILLHADDWLETQHFNFTQAHVGLRFGKLCNFEFLRFARKMFSSKFFQSGKDIWVWIVV